MPYLPVCPFVFGHSRMRTVRNPYEQRFRSQAQQVASFSAKGLMIRKNGYERQTLIGLFGRVSFSGTPPKRKEKKKTGRNVFPCGFLLTPSMGYPQAKASHPFGRCSICLFPFRPGCVLSEGTLFNVAKGTPKAHQPLLWMDKILQYLRNPGRMIPV